MGGRCKLIVIPSCKNLSDLITYSKIPISIIHLVKNLRNATAHNNCIIANLSRGTSFPSHELSLAVKSIPTISVNQRKKKLSCRPMLEFTALLYVYRIVVSEKVKYHRIKENFSPFTIS